MNMNAYSLHVCVYVMEILLPLSYPVAAWRCIAVRTVRTMSAQTDLRFASQTFQQLIAMCPVSLSTEQQSLHGQQRPTPEPVASHSDHH